MTSAMPVHCSTNRAIKPTGSCKFVIHALEEKKNFIDLLGLWCVEKLYRELIVVESF